MGVIAAIPKLNPAMRSPCWSLAAAKTKFMRPDSSCRPFEAAAGVASDIAGPVRPKLGKSNLLILLADTYNFEAEATLEALATELPGVTIAGGGASEDGSIGETFVFCGDTISSNAVSGMLISGDANSHSLTVSHAA